MDINKHIYYLNILKICLAIERKNDLLNSLNLQNFSSDKELLDLYVDCVSDVFCKYGLKEDTEPNECGFILEDVIDYLNNCIYKFEDNF